MASCSALIGHHHFDIDMALSWRAAIVRMAISVLGFSLLRPGVFWPGSLSMMQRIDGALRLAALHAPTIGRMTCWLSMPLAARGVTWRRDDIMTSYLWHLCARGAMASSLFACYRAAIARFTRILWPIFIIAAHDYCAMSQRDDDDCFIGI